MRDAALQVERVSHDFGRRQALREVSFTVPRGDFVALLGVNGAGKTTLVNLITRLYASRSGAIRVCGAELSHAPRAALAALGVVFQSRSLDASLSLRRNFIYVGALYGFTAREALTRAEALLDRVGLRDRLDEKVHALSGGQQRRAEMARALMHRPSLLVCDEASAGLDIRARRRVVDLAHALAIEDRVGVLWATHLTDEIRAEDRVVVLHEGRVLADDRAASLAETYGRRALSPPAETSGASLSDAFLALTDQNAAAEGERP